ncbi:hypothetical protein BG005_011930 [Podila minutissima]|nr:hypothetical protein BG005_011930 [Podila minutissima]
MYTTNTTGDVPDERRDACFVAAYGGTRLVLAGGGNQSTPVAGESLVLSNVYMLDVATLVWTTLADAPSPYYKAICAVSGDNLILYGGYSAHPAVFSGNGSIVTNGNPPPF